MRAVRTVDMPGDWGAAPAAAVRAGEAGAAEPPCTPLASSSSLGTRSCCTGSITCGKYLSFFTWALLLAACANRAVAFSSAARWRAAKRPLRFLARKAALSASLKEGTAKESDTFFSLTCLGLLRRSKREPDGDNTPPTTAAGRTRSAAAPGVLDTASRRASASASAARCAARCCRTAASAYSAAPTFP